MTVKFSDLAKQRDLMDSPIQGKPIKNIRLTQMLKDFESRGLVLRANSGKHIKIGKSIASGLDQLHENSGNPLVVADFTTQTPYWYSVKFYDKLAQLRNEGVIAYTDDSPRRPTDHASRTHWAYTGVDHGPEYDNTRVIAVEFPTGFLTRLVERESLYIPLR